MHNAHNPNGRAPPTAPVDLANGSAISPDASMDTMVDSLLRMSNLVRLTVDFTKSHVPKVAQLKVAEDQMNLIHAMEEELDASNLQQAERLLELREKVEDHLKDTFMDEIKARAAVMVEKAMEELVAEKVKQQLEVLIPQALQEQAADHDDNMLRIKTNLHNSEAMRYNSSAHLSAPSPWTAPLRPLLRPLPSAAQSPAYIVSSNRPWTMNTVPPTPLSAYPGSSPAMSRASSRTSPRILENTTPSQIFPPNLEHLYKMSADDTRKLMSEYGLQESNTRDEGRDREDNMNRFMSHIGVNHKVVGAPSTDQSRSAKALASLPPLIITPGN